MVFEFLTIPPFIQEIIASKMSFNDYANFQQSTKKVSWIVPTSKFFVKFQEVHVNDDGVATVWYDEPRNNDPPLRLDELVAQHPIKLGLLHVVFSNLTDDVCDRVSDLFRRSQTKIGKLSVALSNCSRDRFDTILQIAAVFELVVYIFRGEAPDFSLPGHKELSYIRISTDVDSKFYHLQATMIRLINHSTETEDIKRFFKEWKKGDRSIYRLNLTCGGVHPNLHKQYFKGRIWNRDVFEESTLSKKISFEKLNGPTAVARFDINKRYEMIVVYFMHGRIIAERVYSEEEAYDELAKPGYMF